MFEDNHQVICGRILEMDSIENDTRRVKVFYKTWRNSTEICNKEKSFIITGNVEIITSIMHTNHAFKDIDYIQYYFLNLKSMRYLIV